MKGWVALALVLVVGVGFYLHRRGQGSDRIKVEMLALIADLSLAPGDHAEVRSLAAAAHQQAFDRAMDVTKKLGKKFDERLYLDAVVETVAGQLRGDGKARLADTFEQQMAFSSLNVAER